MTRAEAIRRHCRDCADSPKEVTLCPILGCPLWPFRFGVSMKSRAYRKRMDNAKKKYAKEFKELSEVGKASGYFSPEMGPLDTVPEKTESDQGADLSNEGLTENRTPTGDSYHESRES
jgi:hypothetical protein